MFDDEFQCDTIYSYEANYMINMEVLLNGPDYNSEYRWTRKRLGLDHLNGADTALDRWW